MNLNDQETGVDEGEQQCIQYVARRVFPETVSVHAGLISERGVSRLIGRENKFIENACDKRKREFATGRMLARQCLESFGADPVALLPYKEGNIRWPDGYTGTISHAGPWCLVAVAPISFARGVGIDIENADRMTERVAERIMSEREKVLFNAFDAVNASTAATICFCAKEAIYKAVYPIIKTQLLFKEVEITPQIEKEERLTFEATFKKSTSIKEQKLAGSVTMHEKWIIAGVYI